MRLSKLGAGAERYYLATVAAGLEDHRPGIEPDGRWLGKGSAALGLRGSVTGPPLEAVLAGSDPVSGEVLNPAQSRVKVVGFDLVFAAPKSVSILCGIADEAVSGKVAGAHGSAVEDALGYLERAAISARRRDHGARTSTPATGAIAAGFLHHTSRAADPHLHTHVLVSNLVEGEDGRWSALDARGLYAHGVTAGYLYHSRLRHELVRSLRVSFGPADHGVANLADLDPEVMAHFSQRRHQVTEQLEAWGTAGHRAAAAAAVATRAPKDTSRSIEQLREDWRERAEALGLSRSQVAGLTGRGAPRPQHLDSEAVTAGLVERSGSFGRRQLLRVVAQSLHDGAEVASVEGLSEVILATALERNSIVERPYEPDAWRARSGRRVASGVVEGRWTTKDRARREAAFLADAETRAGWASPRSGLVDSLGNALRTALARRPELGGSQAETIRRLVHPGSGLEVLLAAPGPATSDVLEAAREAWQLAGLRVLELPLARSSDSVRLPGGTASCADVVVVDKTHELGVAQLHDLLTSAGEAKLVLVGDPRMPGPAARLLARLGPSRPVPALGLLPSPQHGPGPVRVELGPQRCAVVGDCGPGLRRALVKDWWAVVEGGRPAVMVARTRAEIDVLNEAARARMSEAGNLGEVVRAGRMELAVGDRVLLRWGNDRLGCTPENLTRIVGFSDAGGAAEARELILRTDTGVQTMLACNRLHPGQLAYGYTLTADEARHLDQPADCLVLGGPEVMERGPAPSPALAARLSYYLLDTEAIHRPHLPRTRAPDQLRDLAMQAMAGAVQVQMPDRARSLAELRPELEGLRRELLGTLPPDPTRQLAELADELAAIRLGRTNATAFAPALVPRWEAAAHSVAERQTHLEQVAVRRQAWVVANQPVLARCMELERAVEERRLALGRIAEVMEPSYVVSVLGPRPAEPADRAAWREAAGAIESFRERWGVTGTEKVLGHPHTGGLARLLEHGDVERSVLDARARLGSGRERDLMAELESARGPSR